MTRPTMLHALTFPFVAWPLGCITLGHGRWEHVALLLGVPLLAFSSARSRRLFLGLLPIGLLGLAYDAMRWVKDVGLDPERVHVCDLRAMDMRLASTTVLGARGTVHDWVQAHPSLTLDVLFAIPYGTFIVLIFGFAIFLYVKDYERMRVFGWTFLLVNLAGFATYHLYPAAPPWYFHAHGCAVDMTTTATEGPNLARVDALLGVPYFHEMYGRSSDVFGAVPSLHVSYPTIVLLFAWPLLRWPGRSFLVLFVVAMCAAAAYLDHHWLVDVVLGLAYPTTVYAAYAATRALLRARSARLVEGPALTATEVAR